MIPTNRTLRTATSLLAVLALSGLTACTTLWTGSDYYESQARLDESDAHIDGEALAQRKDQMRRAHRDLIGMHATMESLRRHKNLEDIRVFEGFLHPYFRDHLDPLLSKTDEGWHEELAPLDANLLFAKAAVLIESRDRRRLDRAIREIARRFGDTSDMLVEYPMGTQSTVARGLIDLRQRRQQI